MPLQRHPPRAEPIRQLLLSSWHRIHAYLGRRRLFPLIRVVDRYLAWEFLKALAVVVVMFYVLGAVIVLFDEIDTFLAKKAPFLVALEYVFRSAPYRLAESGPLMMLLAAVFSVGRLVYGRELDAMIIGGYRLRRLLLPLALVSVVCALGFYLVCEHIICPWRARAEDLMDLTIKGEGTRRGVWMWGQHRRKYYVERFEPATNSMQGVDVIELADNGFHRRIKAAEAKWDPVSRMWHMKGVIEWIFAPEGDATVQRFEERSYLLEEGPEDFSLIAQSEKVLSHANLSHLVAVIQKAGRDPIVYLPHLRLRESLPFSLIIMSLLGVGLAVRTGRGGYVLGLGISVLVALIFYGVLLFFHSCAKKGLLSAGFAAWAPNIIFGSLLVWQLRQIDRTT